MATVEELARFAEANGLEIYPGQDLQNWVDNVLDEDGTCPCTGNVCPCPQALENIKSANSVEDQHCGCFLFASTKLHKQVIVELGGSEPIAVAPEVVQEVIADDPIPEVGEEAARISAVYAKAEKLIAEGRFDEAKDLLKSNTEGMKCDLCAQAMGVESKRAEFVELVCSSGDEETCEFDRKHAIKAMQQMQEMYNEIARENGVDVPEPQKNDKKPQSEYGTCMSTMLGGSSDLTTFVERFNVSDQHKAEMAISAKICSGKAETPEEAVEMVVKAHPDWMKPGV